MTDEKFRGCFILIVSLSLCIFASEVKENSKSDIKEVPNETSTPIVPIMVEVPTPTTAKPDGDGSSVNTLQYIAMITRHGDRYKDANQFFENDPMSVEDPFWLPYGHGQLRNKGKCRIHWLGQLLRNRYNGFLKEEYFYNSVTFYSPDSDRCLMSAQLLSAGLFPPTGINIWNDNVGRFYQPIPIQSFDTNQDIIFNDERECPPYNKELSKVLSQELAEINARYQDIYDFISYHSGRNVTTLQDVNDIYQALRLEHENGRKLPEWTKQVFPSKMKALAGLYNQILYHTDKMKRIKAGPIFREILNDMKSKTSHLVDRRLKMKSWMGYDSTLLKVFHTLKFNTKYSVAKVEEAMSENPDPFELSKPLSDDIILETDYGATLAFELHFINMTYFVKIIYYPSGLARVPKTVLLQEFKNASLIPYSEFDSAYSKFALNSTEWNKRCGVVTC